ncbi:hypothetical protein FRX31_016570 [Thalictrum thalictroides]|uniref:MBD domain-containing protein n=1 Tax=Thalictrum thalictroides TaxID=46969 RepID=A0A7J6W8S7_THATH|nr:hypothetical protein FRX31_016570 [Thalictrum thalictroides]
MSNINTDISYSSSTSENINIPADPQVAAMAAASPASFSIMEEPIAAIPLRFRLPQSSPSTPPAEKRKHNGKWKDVTDRKALKKNTDWVPSDWTIRIKDRLNGYTAGRVDHQFVAPNGIKFRSKKEVMAYREHGTLPKTVSKATRRKLSENVTKTQLDSEDEEKIEAEEKEDEQKVEQEAPASGSGAVEKGWL